MVSPFHDSFGFKGRAAQISTLALSVPRQPVADHFAVCADRPQQRLRLFLRDPGGQDLVGRVVI